MKVSLYQPEYEDLWFRQQMMSDEETMSYNRDWGGTIPFPEEKWREWYDRWVLCPDGKRFYRYLKDDNDTFVGEIAYYSDEEAGGCMASVVVYAPFRGREYGSEGLALLCSAAGENGFPVILDDIAEKNPALSIFLKQGFSVQSRRENILRLRKEL